MSVCNFTCAFNLVILILTCDKCLGAPRLADNFHLLNYFHSRLRLILHSICRDICKNPISEIFNSLINRFIINEVRLLAYRNKPYLPRYFHAKLGLILCSIHRDILNFLFLTEGWRASPKT